MRLQGLVLSLAVVAGLGGVAAGQGLSNDGAAVGAQPAPSSVAPAGAGAVAGGGSTQLFAIVNGDGTIDRDKGGVFAQRLGLGIYEVIFARNVSFCVYGIVQGAPDSIGIGTFGFATVAGRDGNGNGVFVRTADVAGNPDDRAFHLTVFC